ncbi:ADP-ribosylglycohydrolase family protein [Nocardia pseudovaccinii]|uniref:ADP-ribosylglycohydrolase family protein n=1 Tax=Nocardia pseudovaccinii TaxID=189540 RepID=UPI000A876A58|nr:ADP-ribosylglycohydrolase family protein [Nocardia pseudovaccinii]
MSDANELVFFGRHEIDPRTLLFYEWRQRLESGYPVAEFESEVRALVAVDHVEPAECWTVFDRLESTERDPEWGYDESETAAPQSVIRPVAPIPELFERMHGGWLGRCVGCTLGKPLENGFVWTPARIRAYLERAGAYPLIDYVPALLPPSPEYPLNPTWPVSAKGRIDGAPRDDDVDYTVLGLHLLETCGTNFTQSDVADAWLAHLPFLQTYTAERVAYRNLIAGRKPPEVARYRNPYREWIGAMIRADIYGYVNPGKPARAAELAARDAGLSHTGNGVYAAMWAAALVAAAFTAEGVPEALSVAQQCIPDRSRLHVAVAQVIADHDRGMSWERALEAIHRRHDHYNWVHAIPNACLVTAGLLWGAGDFTRTIALTVQGGCDTDSNGATAGSVAGIRAGARGIPAHWTDPFHDRLHSAVFGHDGSRISDLARRTLRLAASHT